MKSLKITDYQKRLDIPANEHKVLDFWDQTDAFKKSIESRPESKSYVFYDGPPFATGLPHYGHLVASTTKDVFPRYWTMKGYRVSRQWGWDCHGLPVENIVEKNLGLETKKDIDDLGVDKFNDACQSIVLKYATEWKKTIRRLGRWVDMEHDYKTMEPWYMESLWWVFKQLWDQKLIYQGHKPMHICPRCSTPLSNFEVTQGYKDVKDISVTVEFELTDPGKVTNTKDRVFFLAWTTTPWTLPGNLLLALNPKTQYVLFKGSEPGKLYIAAKKRLADIVGDSDHHIIKEFAAKDLDNISYQPVFPYFQKTPQAFHTVLADFVTTNEGTGIVHIAPAFGEDDFAVGQKYQLPLVQHVGMDGKFTAAVTDFAGLLVKPKDDPSRTDILLIKYLASHDVLFSKQKITHSYPHCWRCDTPLLNYAADSWFVKVTKFKQQLLDNNQKINWLPRHIKNGRFGMWLENARDWAISRDRYWGTPLPIWQSDDGDTICIGSIKELEQLSGQKVTDLHKQYVDQLVINQDGKEYHRISQVLDCWFESGAMPYASFHYPFANKDLFEQNFPAQFISEGQDQTRGWFYTLHVLATALTMGTKPAIPVKEPTSSFKNCVVTGIVLAEDGKKMSKRLNNYPDPEMVMDKYGVDALRFYLLSSPVMKAGNINFSESGVGETSQKLVNILWNTFTFYKLYCPVTPVTTPQPKHVLDRWLVSRTHQLTLDVTKTLDGYDTITACRLLQDHVTDLSTWYLRRSRDRFKEDPASAGIFGWALHQLAILLAPLTPFITETIFQNLDGVGESIHLQSWPQANLHLIDSLLQEQMKTIRLVVQNVHQQRQQAGIKLRQPLASAQVTLYTDTPIDFNPELMELLKDEVNVKDITFNHLDRSEDAASTLKVVIDTNITPDLQAEGDARELVRQIQGMRKELGISVDQHIATILPDWPRGFTDYIKQKTLTKTLTKGKKLMVTPLS